jgi:cardiolipin synthase
MWKKRFGDGGPEWARRSTALLGRFGRWILVATILCLALVGFLHLTRGTAVRHVRGVASDGVPIAVSEPHFPLVVTMMTGAWMSGGNLVEVTLNGDGTYARLWADLRAARQSITLQLYYGAPGRMAATLGSILMERARAGVRVFILYDAFGTIDIPADQRDALRAAGVRIEPFRPIRLSTLHLAQNRFARAWDRDRQPDWLGRRLRH